jgi:prophage regulatory protein
LLSRFLSVADDFSVAPHTDPATARRTEVEQNTPARLIRIRELIELTGVSRSGIYARMDRNSPYYDGSFPRSFKIGKSSVAWELSSVERWIRLKAMGLMN